MRLTTRYSDPSDATSSIVRMTSGYVADTNSRNEIKVTLKLIDLDELNTGQRREGVFYSFMVLLQKIGLAIGLFLVGQALEMAGFISTIPGQPAPIQPDSALFAIRLAIGPLPTLFLIIGIIFAYLYPITQEVHANILLRLTERKNNQNLDENS